MRGNRSGRSRGGGAALCVWTKGPDLRFGELERK